MRHLDIYLDGILAGEVEQNDSGAVAFSYDREYQGQKGQTPLSLSLPLERTHHRGKAVMAFLAGLLPDSEGRLNAIGREYRVNPRNPVALLEHVGSDAAGAVQIVPHGQQSRDAVERRGDMTIHDDAEFAEIIADVIRNSDTWSTSRSAGRWSLPGAQPKIALFLTEQGRWATPHDSTPTTHILKPSVPPYSDHHINEFMTMAAARHLGLEVADEQIIETVLGDPVFVSKRYDRELRGGVWHRIHQEDMCQAMSVMPAQKYQSDGGPGTKQIARLLASATTGRRRQQASQGFYDALVFNLAMQGTDAHAKNYSLMLEEGDVRLAPLYDLGSHAAYPPSAGHALQLAMSVDGEYRIDAIGIKQLVTVGRSLGLTSEEAEARAREILISTPDAFDAAADEAAAIPNLDDPRSRRFVSHLASEVRRYVETRGWIGPCR